MIIIKETKVLVFGEKREKKNMKIIIMFNIFSLDWVCKPPT